MTANKESFDRSNITRCIVKPRELFCFNILPMSLFISYPSSHNKYSYDYTVLYKNLNNVNSAT